jgi:hypothetical protein
VIGQGFCVALLWPILPIAILTYSAYPTVELIRFAGLMHSF